MWLANQGMTRRGIGWPRWPSAWQLTFRARKQSSPLGGVGSLGVTIGFVERSSLAGNEACLDQVLQVARTPTMLVFDVTAIQRLDQHNRHVLHRHAILVEAGTGLLATVVWALEYKSGDHRD